MNNCPYKFDNLYEMDQSHERHNLPKLTEEEIGHIHRPISIKPTKQIIIFQVGKH
jgi:hypothetical protein